SRLATNERKFAFAVLEVPGAQRTVASGIDRDGQIVGYYGDSAGATHGFLFRAGTYETIDFTGAAFTQAFGIGASGEIVGSYRLAGEPVLNFHGFRRSRDGRFARVDSPGHLNTIAQRILSDGTILGCRHDNDFGASMKGVVFRGHANQEVEAFGSMDNGATPDLRRIVGLYNYGPADHSSAL